MQKQKNYDRRQNRGHETHQADDLDLEQRQGQRRNSHRLALRLWTEGRSEGRLDFHNCSNLSEDGIFVETPEPYALNTIVQIEFNLPGVQEPVRTSCRVVSSLDDQNAGPNIMGNGFSFDAMSPADRDLIRAYISASQLIGE